MLKQSLLVTTFFFVLGMQPLLASTSNSKAELHDNEHHIEFKTNEGKTTDAVAGFLSVKENAIFQGQVWLPSEAMNASRVVFH